MRKILWRNTFRILPAVMLGLIAGNLQAQITNEVFFEDFSSGTIDPANFEPDAPFFEGGIGVFSSAVVNGELEFTGTVSQRWWAGATLRLVPTFTVSEEVDIVVSVDRVREAGVGSASRSALWIMDDTQTKYVLFADVRGEEGWRFNRKIGEAGDNPTGGGTILTAFDGATFDNGLLHRMKVVANGETVRLYLDDIFGAEARFPYKNLVFHVGSYARNDGRDPAGNPTPPADTAHTIFDNLKVETVGKVTFGQSGVTLQQGQSAQDIIVRVPPGVNAASAVQIRVVSSAPAVAIPVGAVGDTLTLTFAAGAPNEQVIGVQAVSFGGAAFTLQNDIGMSAGNTLNVTVIEPAGIRLQDDFAAALDTAKWELNEQGFEAGTGTFVTDTFNGALEIYGFCDVQYWAGNSVKSVRNFTATQELPLIVEVDRVSIDPATSTAARTGIFLTTDDRSRFIWFGQNYGETGWQINLSPGNPTGSGTALAAFSALAGDTASRKLRIVADGSVAEVFLDGVSGGQFPFPVSSGLHVELGAYARANTDYVSGVFDNVKVQNAVPCISAAPRAITTARGDNSNVVTVTIPRLLNATQAVNVTVTSADPSVAAPEGAVGGSLTLNFAAGAANSQSFSVVAGGKGLTTFQLANDAGACLDVTSLAITVTSALGVEFSDDFATAIDPAKWDTISTPLNAAIPGTATAGSGVTIDNGQVKMAVTAETAEWPGFALTMIDTYSAALLDPVAFEIDRVQLGKVLVTGTSAKQRAGVWVLDANSTNYVFFGEYATWDGTAGGWQYNRVIGQAGDTALPAAGVAIPAFNAARFNDQGNHRIRVLVNGVTAALFLDGVFGAEVPFPVTDNIKFGFGTYVLAATDIATGLFDNAAVLTAVETLGTLAAAVQANGDVVISWEGAGNLQSSAVLGDPQAWSAVSPAPTGNSVTIPAAQLGQQRFYRLAP
jgi:hypothetical protein